MEEFAVGSLISADLAICKANEEYINYFILKVDTNIDTFFNVDKPYIYREDNSSQFTFKNIQQTKNYKQNLYFYVILVLPLVASAVNCEFLHYHVFVVIHRNVCA